MDRPRSDDALHASQRRASEAVRAGLLAARTNGATAAQLIAQLRQANPNAATEMTWQLGARPREINARAAQELEVKKQFGPDAQILSTPHRADGNDPRSYFEDLPAELQRVLRVQLRQAGDVTAVIEMPDSFRLYVCKETTSETLSVAALSWPKRSYEAWLAEQDAGAK
jgi:hypothetical protein